LHFYLTRGELQLVTFVTIETLPPLVAFLSDPWGVATVSVSAPSKIAARLHFYLTRGELQLSEFRDNSEFVPVAERLHFYLTRGELQPACDFVKK